MPSIKRRLFRSRRIISHIYLTEQWSNRWSENFLRMKSTRAWGTLLIEKQVSSQGQQLVNFNINNTRIDQGKLIALHDISARFLKCLTVNIAIFILHGSCFPKVWILLSCSQWKCTWRPIRAGLQHHIHIPHQCQDPTKYRRSNQSWLDSRRQQCSFPCHTNNSDRSLENFMWFIQILEYLYKKNR